MGDRSVPALEADDLSAGYRGSTVLDHVSFVVPQGAFAALIGPNGAGKSTLLRVLLGLVKPTSGSVRVFGEPVGAATGGIGYVPQRVVIPRGFPITVLDIVLMGRYGALGPGRRPGRADETAAREALASVQLADQIGRRFQDLSGGQQQRALIARALAGHPRLLLLDEPTAGLDTAARARFYALVCELRHARDMTLLSATHDLDVVSDHADQLILLNRTVHAVGEPSRVLESAAVGAAYPMPLGHVHGGEGV